MISVIILTKDEEVNISKCLISLHWCDDIHIVDSGSLDETITICQSFKTKIYSNPFSSFGQQRNWAIDNCEIKYDWLLFLDADERSTISFYQNLVNVISSSDNECVGYYCCWKLMLNDKWLRRSDSFPRWQFRLLKRGMIRFIDVGHGQKEGKTSGELGYIKEPYEHYAFSKGWFDWFGKHNRYSTQEALQRYYSSPSMRDIFSKHSSKRNVVIKNFLTKLFLWPMIRFVYSYFLKLGILEGKEGLIYGLNMFFYEYMICIKYLELKTSD